MKNRMKTAFWVVFAAFLTACASTPPQSLKTRVNPTIFTSADPSSVAFRKITEGIRGCYAKRHVTADFFTDNQTGQITMSVLNDFASHAILLVDIEPNKESQGSKISSYTVGDKSFSDAVKSWSAGDYKPCPFGG